MKLRKTVLVITGFMIWGCSNSDTKYSSTTNQNKLNIDTILLTGFYLINDSATNFKRQLLNTNETFNIEPTPIVTIKNFDKTEMFHEKDCYALFIWLDKNGSQSLDKIKQNNKEETIAIIIDNKLIRTQKLGDPQFAKVSKDNDPREYGQVLAFPCNSFLQTQLQEFESKIKKEK